MTFPEDLEEPATAARSFKKLFLIFVLLLFGVLIAIGAYSYQVNDRQVRAGAGMRAAAAGAAVETTIRISKRILDRVIHDYVYHYKSMEKLVGSKEFFSEVSTDFPQFVSFWLVDSKGEILWTTCEDFPGGGDESAKPYFFQSLKSQTMYIGDPGFLADGRPVFIISKQALDASGRVTGVAALAVKSSFLDVIGPGLEKGTDNSYALVDLEGKILARTPMIPGLIGQKAKSEKLMRSLSAENVGDTFLVERTNKGRRIVSISRIKGRPLVAVATTIADDILILSLDTILGVVLPIIICLVFMTVFLLRTLKSLSEMERERFIAESGLRENEKRLRLLADNLPNVVVYQLVIEADGTRRLSYVGRNIERLNGVSVEDVYSDVSIIYNQVSPEYRAGFEARENAAIESLTSFNFEAEFNLPDGRIRWFELCSTPRPQADGTVFWDGVLIDISDRKTAEKALVESEKKYRHYVEHAPSGIYEIDWLTGRFIRVNDSICDLLGYDREELLNISPFDLMTETGVNLFTQRRLKSLAGEQISENAEFEIITKNGHHHWVSIHSRMLYEDGRPVRAQVVAHDITERKHFEELLKHREEHLQAILESTDDGILVVDKEGMITYTNRLFIKMWDLSPEILERNDANLLLDTSTVLLADPFEFRQTMEKIYGTPEENLTNLEFTDGRVYECFSCPLLEDGKVSGRVWSFRDISERKRAEEVLRESEEKYRLLAENVSDNLWIMDLASLRFTYVSPSVKSINGYTPEEAVGKPIENVLTPQSLEIALTALREELDKEKLEVNLYRSRTLELEQYHKNGSTLWTEVNVKFIRDGSGQVSGILGVTRDISERKRLEAQLQQAQKMEAVGTLASGIAHDFNNILQGITGYIQLLLNSDELGPGNRSALVKMDEMSVRAVNLVRQMMTFCRRAEVRLEPVELNREVLQAVNILERTIPKMIKIECRLAPDLNMIWADATQIGQIIMNLGANARDAMPRGGELFMETKKAEPADLPPSLMNIMEETGREFLILTVKDTGLGIDQDTMNRIFEPFFTTKEVGQGTGLGLSTVYGIVKNHGGYVNCDSIQGQGTCFTVYLPVLSGDEKLTPGEGGMDPIQQGSENILLVDDEEAIIEVAREMLEQYGYAVTTANSGEEAVIKYRNMGDGIDLVVLDLGMPGMGGHSCMRELLKLDPAARVIISSGYSVSEEVKETLDSGAAGFIAKPYQLTDLLKTIRQVLDDRGQGC